MLDRSRRHQQRQRARRLVVALLVVALVLVFVDARRGPGSLLHGVHGVAATVTAPVLGAANAVVGPVRDAAGAVLHARDSADRAATLERENEALRRRSVLQGDADRRLASLEKTLGAAAAGRFTVVAASTIAVGGGFGFEWTAQVDAGSADGVTVNQTVINGDGLVGRVVAVTPSTATVLLAIDPNFTVGVRIEGTRQIGLLAGRGLAPQRLQMLDPTAVLRPGGTVLTLGSRPTGSPFVAGVAVGTILQVEATGTAARTALVDPTLRATALDVVGIVIGAPRPRRSPSLPSDGAGGG